MARKLPRIYQIKVTLNGVKPPIWRRLRVSSITELTELHDILQIAMGWTDSHLQRKAIGEDVKTLQFGWPIGMPLVRKMTDNLWELRSHISTGIARTFFTVFDNQVVLLHGFVKKSWNTPPRELAIAKRRLAKLRS